MAPQTPRAARHRACGSSGGRYWVRTSDLFGVDGRAALPPWPHRHQEPHAIGHAALLVGDTGFEPVTSSVSTAEPRYHHGPTDTKSRTPSGMRLFWWAILGSNQ